MADLARLEELLSEQEARVRDAFREFIESVGSGAAFDAIVERLEARDINGAMAIADSYVLRMADVLPAINQIVGAEAAAELAAILPGVVQAVSFDPSHPRAAELVRRNRLEFVQQFSAEQRKATQQALNRGFREGLGTADTARLFRSSIGLTAYQEQIIENYRTQLRNLDRRALDRSLRDRRSDRSLETAIARNRPLTEKQIDSMVARYRNKWLAFRSENIARTEALTATSMAREEAVEQMIEQTGIGPERVEDIWNTSRDKRVRDFHATMQGQIQQHGQPFLDGLGNRLRYPGDPAAPAKTRIGCRCAKTYRIKAAA